jgi:HlyD family secretion protein
MDIRRPSNPRTTRFRRSAYGVVAIIAVVLVTIGVSRLTLAAPGVERSTVSIDTVRRGPLVRQVRGLGTLVPEDIRWIPAMTEARVERIALRPGTIVRPDSVILELSNPAVEQALQDARLKVQAAEAGLANVRVQLRNDALQQQAAAAAIEADWRKAALQVEVNEQLAARQLVASVLVKQSRLDADQLAARLEIARKQLAGTDESTRALLAVQQSEVDQARAALDLRVRQAEALHVRAGVAGVLQLVMVDVGQQVTPGTNLARVADPSRLIAELKIAETQARDAQAGQRVSIDTHNGTIGGHVVRIDPSVQNGTVSVDVSLDGPPPKGARPDLSVDGTIELERIDDVLCVGRPESGQEQDLVTLFKVQPGGWATRVRVKLGRSSVNSVEVVSGLSAGDQVIVSDMSAWDAVNRIRLQ